MVFHGSKYSAEGEFANDWHLVYYDLSPFAGIGIGVATFEWRQI